MDETLGDGGLGGGCIEESSVNGGDNDVVGISFRSPELLTAAVLGDIGFSTSADVGADSCEPGPGT